MRFRHLYEIDTAVEDINRNIKNINHILIIELSILFFIIRLELIH